MQKNWKTVLAAMMGEKPTAKMLFEINDANGTTLTFPDASDLSEVVEGVATTAADGNYVFEADSKIYSITVLGGVVTTLAIADAVASKDVPALNAETVELLQAFASEFESQSNLIANLQGELKSLKSLIGHKDDKTGDSAMGLKVGNKTIDLTKINL